MRRLSVHALAVTGAMLLSACGAGRAPTSDPAATRPSSTVTADDIARSRSDDQSIEKALAGRVAGVVVTRTPDGGIAVRIRGGSSIYGNNAPLYVVDGMPVDPGPNGSLTGVNPSDIESIRVLKEPAETSLYGSRGANGVILIKLKKR